MHMFEMPHHTIPSRSYSILMPHHLRVKIFKKERENAMERRLTFFFPRLGSRTLQGSPITPATRFNEEMPAYTNRERPEATEAAGGAILSGTLPTGLSPIQTRPHRGLDLQNGSSTTPTPYTRHALHKHSLPRSQLPEREREMKRKKKRLEKQRKLSK